MSNIATQQTVLSSDMEQATQTTTPPTLSCRTCNSQAQWLPNGQLYCGHCKTALQVQNRSQQQQVAGEKAAGVVGAVLIGIVLIVLGFLYLRGQFDEALQPLGLNAHQCVKMFNDGPTWSVGDIKCGNNIPPGLYFQ